MHNLLLLILFSASFAHATAHATDCGEYIKLTEQIKESMDFDDIMTSEVKHAAAHKKVKNNSYVKTYDELINQFSEIKKSVKDQNFKRSLSVHEIGISMAYDDAIAAVCNKDRKQSLSSVIPKATEQLIIDTRKMIGYIKAQQYAIEGSKQDPTTYATLCHQRKSNDTAYVATAKYSKKIKSFVTKGWKTLHIGDCISYDKHTYTYISWGKPDGRASPPRLYTTMPQGKFCIINKSEYISFNKDSEELCKSDEGRLKTFLKLGMKSETLQ